MNQLHSVSGLTEPKRRRRVKGLRAALLAYARKHPDLTAREAYEGLGKKWSFDSVNGSLVRLRVAGLVPPAVGMVTVVVSGGLATTLKARAAAMNCAPQDLAMRIIAECMDPYLLDLLLGEGISC